MRPFKLRIPPVAIGFLAAGLMWLVAAATPGVRIAVPWSGVIAAGLAAGGLAIGVLGVASFRRAKTTVNPLRPATASSLVVSGIYRWTRNPMYLGMLLLLLGWAAFLGNFLTLAFPGAFVFVMNRLQIEPEERALARRFGAEFSTYRSQVRRWL